MKHFLNSLTLLPLIDKPRLRLLDIGTGAEFPGLPLKIVRPQWSVTLLEATGKKVTFVNHVIDTLHLTDVVGVDGRAEELAHKPAYRARFDVVTARAVAAIPTLLEYSAPYCRVGGLIIFPKKGDLTDELTQGKQAAKLVGGLLSKPRKRYHSPAFPMSEAYLCGNSGKYALRNILAAVRRLQKSLCIWLIRADATPPCLYGLQKSKSGLHNTQSILN